jgi:L-lactate utilization protein LutC
MEEKLSLNDRFTIKFLEEQYSSNKMMFLLENPNKIEKDFIENNINNLELANQEWQRKVDLSDKELYQEFKNEEKYKKAVSYGKTKEELDECLENNLKKHREKYKLIVTTKESTALTYYKTKLKDFPIIDQTQKPKQNKKLLLNGTKLNILERYQILNKVLKFDDTVRPLNISNDEKNTLLSYILDIDESNARKLFNGNYKDADCRDLNEYFTELNLNK